MGSLAFRISFDLNVSILLLRPGCNVHESQTLHNCVVKFLETDVIMKKLRPCQNLSLDWKFHLARKLSLLTFTGKYNAGVAMQKFQCGYCNVEGAVWILCRKCNTGIVMQKSQCRYFNTPQCMYWSAVMVTQNVMKVL